MADSAQPRQQLIGVQQHLVSAHLLVLTRFLRRSANADYTGLEPENWIERRIILTLVRLGPAGVTELANSLGNDIAQVSRALSSLHNRGLLHRANRRAPYDLAPDGRALADVLDRLALDRDLALTAGFGPLEKFELGGMMASLCARAMDILADEAASAKMDEVMADLPRRTGLEVHNRVIPAIFGLSNYIARGATLAIKRLTGLSQYEWRVLAFIASRPGISFMELVATTDSDKAQLSRALDPLVLAGLLVRTPTGRGKQACYDVSERGQAVHAVMQSDALRRNALLLADFNGPQQTRLTGFLTRLIATADGLTLR